MQRASRTVAILTGLVCLAASPGYGSTSVADSTKGLVDLDLRHAHFLWAGGDSLQAWRMLGQAGAASTLDSSTAAVVLRQVDGWALGDTLAPVVSTESEIGDELEELETWYRFDLGTLPSAAPEAARARLAWSALALERGDAPTALGALDEDVPRPLRGLRWRLLAEAQEQLGNATAARSWWEKLARASDSEGPEALRAEAAMRMARLALEGQDAKTARRWLEGIEPSSAQSARAEFLRLLLRTAPPATAEEWSAYAQTHPDHPLAREARLRLAAAELDSARYDEARETYTAILRTDEARDGRLATLLADSTALVQAVWSDANTPVLTPRDTDIAGLGTRLLSSIFEDLPRGDDEDTRSSWRTPPPKTGLAPTLEETRRQGRLVREWGQTVFELRRRQKELDEAQAQHDSALRRQARGRREFQDAARQMAAADSVLQLSESEADSTRSRWLAMRDRALEHLRRRAGRLTALALENRDRADRIDLLYLQGPMARLEHRALPSIPLPTEILARERTLRGELASESRDYAAASEAAILHRVEDTLLPRLFARLDRSRASADSLRGRSDAVRSWLDGSRSTEATATELAAARQRVEQARLAVIASRHRLDDYRLQVARRVAESARAKLAAAGEAPLYGAAVATLQLGIAADDDGARLEEARAELGEFLERYPHSKARSDVRYRLADAELVTARADFQRRMGRYLDEGEDHRALMPLWKVDEPIALYESILQDDPDFDRSDRVLFQLGMLHADLADGRAVAPLARLVDEHPDSPLVDAAQLRLGELAFEDKDWREATSHLEVAAMSQDLPTRVVALYKLGWSRYALDDFRPAVEAFLDLLDVYDTAGEHPELGFDIARESRDLLVRSLARSGGADAYAEAFDARGERPYAARVLLDLQAMLSDYALEDASAAVDRTFLERFPTHPAALDAARRQAAHIENDAELAALADRFRQGQPWAAAVDSDSLATAGDRFALSIFETRARQEHRRLRAQDSASDSAWSRLQSHYEDLLTRWPDAPASARWRLLAAECAASQRRWPVALDYVHAASAAATDSLELARTADWQGVAYRDAWYQLSRPDSSTVGADSLATGLLTEIDGYTQKHPEDPRDVDLQWQAAQLAWAHERRDDAASRFADFARNHPDEPRAAQALRSRAELLYAAADYDAAGSAFGDALAHAREYEPDQDRAELQGWIVNCAYRGAEAAAADSTRDRAEVARRWEDVATTYPGSENADRAWYNAALAWPDSERSRAAYRRVWEGYPESSLRLDAARNLARSYEDSGELASAAETLREFAKAASDAEDAPDALLHAVDLYEKLEQPALRSRTLDEYLALYPDDTQTRAFVLSERASAELDRLDASSTATLASLLASPNSALSQLRAFASEDPGRMPASIRARMAFLRAEELRNDYLALELSQPLEASVKRKQTALTQLLKAYGEVGDTAVAPWAQAAAYRSGEALMDFGDALRESERPSDLKGDDLAAYDEVIEDQAWNFFDRGEATWKELLRADTPEEADAWVERTRHDFYRRTSQRYLHMPTFDFPLVEAQAPRNAGLSAAR